MRGLRTPGMMAPPGSGSALRRTTGGGVGSSRLSLALTPRRTTTVSRDHTLPFAPPPPSGISIDDHLGSHTSQLASQRVTGDGNAPATILGPLGPGGGLSRPWGTNSSDDVIALQLDSKLIEVAVRQSAIEGRETSGNSRLTTPRVTNNAGDDRTPTLARMSSFGPFSAAAADAEPPPPLSPLPSVSGLAASSFCLSHPGPSTPSFKFPSAFGHSDGGGGAGSNIRASRHTPVLFGGSTAGQRQRRPAAHGQVQGSTANVVHGINMLLVRCAFEALRGGAVSRWAQRGAQRLLDDMRRPGYLAPLEVVDVKLSSSVPVIKSLRSVVGPINAAAPAGGRGTGGGGGAAGGWSGAVWPQLVADVVYDGCVEVTVQTTLELRKAPFWQCLYDTLVDSQAGGPGGKGLGPCVAAGRMSQQAADIMTAEQEREDKHEQEDHLQEQDQERQAAEGRRTPGLPASQVMMPSSDCRAARRSDSGDPAPAASQCNLARAGSAPTPAPGGGGGGGLASWLPRLRGSATAATITTPSSPSKQPQAPPPPSQQQQKPLSRSSTGRSLRPGQLLSGLVRPLRRAAAARAAAWVDYLADALSCVPFKLTVTVTRFEGSIMLWVPPPPSDRLWLSLLAPPVVELSARPVLAARVLSYSALLGRVSGWLQAKLLRGLTSGLVFPGATDVPLPLFADLTTAVAAAAAAPEAAAATPGTTRSSRSMWGQATDASDDGDSWQYDDDDDLYADCHDDSSSGYESDDNGDYREAVNVRTGPSGPQVAVTPEAALSGRSSGLAAATPNFSTPPVTMTGGEEAVAAVMAAVVGERCTPTEADGIVVVGVTPSLAAAGSRGSQDCSGHGGQAASAAALVAGGKDSSSGLMMDLQRQLSGCHVADACIDEGCNAGSSAAAAAAADHRCASRLSQTDDLVVAGEPDVTRARDWPDRSSGGGSGLQRDDASRCHPQATDVRTLDGNTKAKSKLKQLNPMRIIKNIRDRRRKAAEAASAAK